MTSPCQGVFQLKVPGAPTTLLGVFILFLFATVTDGRLFKIGLLAPWNNSYDFSGYTSASAVTIAIDRVRSDPELNANGEIELR